MTGYLRRFRTRAVIPRARADTFPRLYLRLGDPYNGSLMQASVALPERRRVACLLVCADGTSAPPQFSEGHSRTSSASVSLPSANAPPPQDPCPRARVKAGAHQLLRSAP